jgi:ATP-dependent Lon protease
MNAVISTTDQKNKGAQDDYSEFLAKMLAGTNANYENTAVQNFTERLPAKGADATSVDYFQESDITDALSSPIDKDATRYLQHMKKMGSKRALRSVPAVLDFSALETKFPNFSEVTRFMRKQVELCLLSGSKVADFQPLLLLGDPGVGKTRYLFEISRIIGLEFTVVQCGAVTANFVLSGSSSSWQNGKPGKIHTTLRDGETANPIILLDEIDKMSGSRDYDAYGPLYQLLEKKTATRFVDEAINVPNDCSHIIWVATANDIHTIPEAIQSRMVIVHVPTPTKEQIPRVVASIYKDLLDEHAGGWGSAFESEINPNLACQLYNLAPREIRHRLLAAFGNAAMRYAGAPTHSKLELHPCDISDGVPEKAAHALGFIG